jgi:hypothetical protein
MEILKDRQPFSTSNADRPLSRIADIGQNVNVSKVRQKQSFGSHEVEPDHPAELSQRIFRLDQFVEFVLQAICFGLCAADERTMK